MVDYKVTKTKFLQEVNNCYCHNFYYLVYVRVFNKEHTKYLKSHFVVCFDTEELYEYFEEKTSYSEEDLKEYLGEAIDGFIGTIDNFDNLTDFVAECNNSLRNYYRRIA